MQATVPTFHGVENPKYPDSGRGIHYCGINRRDSNQSPLSFRERATIRATVIQDA